MKLLNKDLSQISHHKYLRFDCKYWNTQERITFSKYLYIKDIFEIISGSVQTQHYVNEKTDFPYIRIGDLNYKYGVIKDEIIYLDTNEDVSDERILRKGDLILATIGATVGKIGLADGVVGGTHSNNTIILRPKSKLNMQFYEKLFQTDLYIQYIFGVVSQKAQPNLQTYDIENIKVPILNEQEIEKIISLISPIEEKINDFTKNIVNPMDIINRIISEELSIDTQILYEIDRRHIFSKEFSDFSQSNSNFRFSYRWNKGVEIQKKLVNMIECCKPLGKYILSTKNGWSPDCSEFELDYQVLGVDSINNTGVLSFDNVKYSNIEKSNFDTYIVHDGDFFVSRGNTTDLVALASIAKVDKDDPITIYPDLMIKLTLSDRINKKYLAFVINSFIGRLYFKYVTKGKNQTMVKVSPKELKEFMIPIPDMDKQEKIVQLINNEFEKQKEIKKQIMYLRTEIDKIIENTICKGDAK